MSRGARARGPLMAIQLFACTAGMPITGLTLRIMLNEVAKLPLWVPTGPAFCLAFSAT